jgi:branched-chain amino acid transport system substrate-binding protein
MAARGNAMVRGIELAADQVARFSFIGPDTPLELRIEDSAGDPAAAGNAVSALLDAEVSAIVGPIDGRSLLAALPRASAAGVPVLVPSAAPTGGLERGDGVFHVAPFEAAIAQAAVAAAAGSIGEGAVRLLTVGDTPQAREAADALRAAATDAGLQIDGEDAATSPEALTAALAALRAEPPALLLLADSPADHDMLLGALRRDAPATTTIVGGDAFNTGQPAPGDGDGVITADLWHRSSTRPENNYFIADWREAYDNEPGTDAVRAYSAVVLAAHAIRLVCSVESQEVRFGFDAIRDAATPLGPWTFGADGGPSLAPTALVWRAGERLPYATPSTAAP